MSGQKAIFALGSGGSLPEGLGDAILEATGVAVSVIEIDSGCDEGFAVIGPPEMDEVEAQGFFEDETGFFEDEDYDEDPE